LFLLPLPRWERVGERVKKSRLPPLAKALRKDQTEAEKRLWILLKARQLEGLKFRRQAPIGNYTADFVCFEARLIIEIDGGQHAAEDSKDLERSAWLQSQGFKVLRFWNDDVLVNTEVVMNMIWAQTAQTSSSQ
jgi:very-short-patch-repair endonuclease